MAKRGSNIYKRKDGRFEGRVPVGYRENGVTWSFDGAQLSMALCNMVTPVATVIGG